MEFRNKNGILEIISALIQWENEFLKRNNCFKKDLCHSNQKTKLDFEE